MSHPVNRRDRFQMGVIKSKKRTPHFYIHLQKQERISLTKKYECYYRNVTIRCSKGRCCGNRRKYFNELTMQELKYGQGSLYPDE